MEKSLVSEVLGNRFLLVSLAAYLVVFLLFFPSFYTSTDEHEVLKGAIGYANLDIFEEKEEFACGSGQYSESGDGFVPRSFFMRPLSIVPFLPLGLGGVMLSGLVIHLANFFLLAAIFRKLKINPGFLALYLFFPTFVWASRTLFAELLVGTLLLIGFYFYISKNDSPLGPFNRQMFLSGLGFGLAFLTRFDSGLAFMAFLVPLAYRSWKEKKFRKLVSFIAPFALAIAFFLLFNSLVFGDALRSAYGDSLARASGISLETGSVFTGWVDDLLFEPVLFAGLLLLFYPLMVLSPFLRKRTSENVYRFEFLLLILSYLFIAAKFGDLPSVSLSVSFLSSLLIGSMRYLIPLAVLLVIPYSAWLQGLMEKRGFSGEKFFYVALAFLVASALMFSYMHSSILDNRYATFDAIHGNVPGGSLVIGSSDDCIYFQKNLFPDVAYLRVREPENGAGHASFLAHAKSLGYAETYVVSLSYSYRQGRDSGRQGIVDAERQILREFIEANGANLELVHTTDSPNPIDIYRVK